MSNEHPSKTAAVSGLYHRLASESVRLGRFDLIQWNEDYFTRLKDLVAEAGKQGIVVGKKRTGKKRERKGHAMQITRSLSEYSKNHNM